VSGKVTLDNQPVTGTITFLYPDNKELNSPLGPQGNYRIQDPPPGTVKIIVKGMGALTPPTKGGPALPDMPGMPKGATGVEPPQKYTAANSTPLTYEVKGGHQTYDIPLSP